MAQTAAEAREQIAADLDAAFGYLREHPRAGPRHVASLGFCFGAAAEKAWKQVLAFLKENLRG